MTRLTKKILNKLFYFYRLINHTISKRFLKKKYIAHHGLQRNGTNFLLHALRHLDVDVINEFDKKRNKPQHKHFRWYSSKENIPEQIYAEYFNSLIAENVHEVNALCNFPRDTKHIVIYKEENSSIVSVLNWVRWGLQLHLQLRANRSQRSVSRSRVLSAVAVAVVSSATASRTPAALPKKSTFDLNYWNCANF